MQEIVTKQIHKDGEYIVEKERKEYIASLQK